MAASRRRQAGVQIFERRKRQMRWSGAESRASGGRQVWTGRLLERWGGWIFPHRRRSVRTTESRLCATRDLENNVFVWAGPRATRVRVGRLRRCRLPDPLREPRSGRRRVVAWLGARVLRARARRMRGWALFGVPCSGRPRPDAARRPGVVSADSCGPGAAGGPASGGSDSRGGRFSSSWGPPRAAPPEDCRFPSFYYLLTACVLWFSWCT